MMPLHCSGDSSATFSEVSASKVCQGKNQGGRSSNQMKVVRAKRKKKPRQPTEQIMTCEDEIALNRGLSVFQPQPASSQKLRTTSKWLPRLHSISADLQEND